MRHDRERTRVRRTHSYYFKGACVSQGGRRRRHAAAACVAGARTFERLHVLGDTNDAVRAGAEQPVGTRTHARIALSASTIDNPPRLCACRSIVCASAPVGQRQRRLHGVRCEGRPAAAQNLARERQSSSQQRAVRTQSRSSRSGTGRPACASSCSRRRPCTARGSTCCPTPPRPPRPCPAPARRRTPCRRAPRGRTIGPTRARGNEGTFFTIDAVRPYTPICRFTAPLRATPLWRAAFLGGRGG